MEKTPEEISRQEQAAKTARQIWMFLTPIFAALALLNLYRWSQGGDDLPGFLSQSGMVFVGLSMIVGKGRKPLQYIFLALGLICVLSGLAMLIMKFRG